MDVAALKESMRSQRKRWVPIAEGKRVQVLLPTEVEVAKHFIAEGEAGKLNLSADIEQVRLFTVNWEGVTEADLLGAGVGASDAVPFDAGLWDLLVSDHLDWMRTVAAGLLEGIVERQMARAVDVKN